MKKIICYYISYSGNLFNILKVIKYGSLNHSIYTNYYKVGLVYSYEPNIKLKNLKNDSENTSLNLSKSNYLINLIYYSESYTSGNGTRLFLNLINLNINIPSEKISVP